MASSNDLEWDEFQKAVKETIDSNLLQLRDIWARIGISGQVLRDRYDQTLEHYKDLSLRMYEEDTGLYDRLMNTVEGHIQTLHQYCHDLGLEVPVLEEAPPLFLKHELISKLEQLTILREARLDRLKELRQAEDLLCSCLFMEAHSFLPNRAVPTEEDLHELSQHIEMLAKEKATRKRKYCIIRSDVARAMTALEKQPETLLEQELCTETEEDIILSQDKLDAMKALHEQLMKEKDQAIALHLELSKKLQFLWDNLDENKQYRQNFIATNGHYGRSALMALEREISKCQELRMANMGTFVKNIRQELLSLWKKCHATENQKKTFQDNMNNSIYTEELLKRHEQEVMNWRVTYQTFKSLFENVDKIDTLFQRALQLQHKLNDPARLYNRGGQLLQEERERKKLLQQIPKMEKELLIMASQYEDTTGTVFTVDGVGMQEHLQSRWNLLYQEKENEKQQRKHRKEEEMSMATPHKTPRTGAATPFRTPGSSISMRPTPGSTLKTPSRSRRQLLKSPRACPSTSRARVSPYPKRQVPSTPGGAAGPSMISFTSFERPLNDPSQPENKRSTMNSSMKRGPKVLGSRVVPQFTNSGKKRTSIGMSQMKNSSRKAPSNVPSSSNSVRGKGLALPSDKLQFLF